MGTCTGMIIPGNTPSGIAICTGYPAGLGTIMVRPGMIRLGGTCTCIVIYPGGDAYGLLLILLLLLCGRCGFGTGGGGGPCCGSGYGLLFICDGCGGVTF